MAITRSSVARRHMTCPVGPPSTDVPKDRVGHPTQLLTGFFDAFESIFCRRIDDLTTKFLHGRRTDSLQKPLVISPRVGRRLNPARTLATRWPKRRRWASVHRPLSPRPKNATAISITPKTPMAPIKIASTILEKIAARSPASSGRGNHPGQRRNAETHQPCGKRVGSSGRSEFADPSIAPATAAARTRLGRKRWPPKEEKHQSNASDHGKRDRIDGRPFN